jgi:sugar transferase (PEP-CTERM/EpsH1 system associated)
LCAASAEGVVVAVESILYLTHRIPFPPNKGDKVRSFNLLRFLCKRYRVHLGTFVDHPDDLAHTAQLDKMCASLKAITLRPSIARLRSAVGLWTGEALTLPYYRNTELAQWIDGVVREHAIGKAIVFSSAMAQYVLGRRDLRLVVDFVDVDSAKWDQYGRSRPWPFSAIYGREGRRLLAFERVVAARADASVFVTQAEASLFCELAPECARTVHFAQNGVDTDYFSPDASRASPFAPGEDAIVFTGAMDYWPNIDAVTWFASEVMPAIVARRPSAHLYVVGMQPAPTVTALDREPCITVTGGVPDTRPYLQHARIVVAPLRVARGIQNKVLEGMAMGRPVVASQGAAEGIAAADGIDFEVAADADAFAEKSLALMADEPRSRRMGEAARARVIAAYSWSANLLPFASLVDGDLAGQAAAG